MRITLQTALVAALTAIAIIWFMAPARAEDSCTNWVTDMQEDEGGAVLTTHVCSDDPGAAWLAMICADGNIWIRYDLAVGQTEKEPQSNEVADVEFVTDEGIEAIPMMFQEMDAMFAGDTPADGPLMKLLKGGKSVLIRDAAGGYPARTYSLKGSSAAIAKLVAECR
jgi:hypothetical protein